MSEHNLRHQPVKSLFLAYQLVSTVCVRLPIWVLLAVPRFFDRALIWLLFTSSPQILASKSFLEHTKNYSNKVLSTFHLCSVEASFKLSVIGTELNGIRVGPLVVSPNHLAIAPGGNVHGVWVEPVPELITGDLKTFASVAGVEPSRIPGYWLFKNNRMVNVQSALGPEEKVVYSLHGGGYVRLSGHPNDMTASIAKGLLKHIAPVSRVFSLEYRLSVGQPYTPEHPFPAALLDALAGYSYLVNGLSISPSDIIIEGDSAGGNLALALVRYLVEHKDVSDVKLPLVPCGLILLSPWCDLGMSHVKPGASVYTCLDTDYIGHLNSNYATVSFLGPHGLGAAEVNKYISPASLNPGMSVEFKDYPKAFIVAGGAEILLDQIRTLKEKMTKDMGEENVHYHEAVDGVHDYLMFSTHEPERTETLKAIAAWVDHL